MLQDLLTDFNTAKSQSNLIPAGTIAKVQIAIQPGGYDGDCWLTKSRTTGSVYLNTEFIVTEGPYAKHRIYQIIGIKSSKADGEDRWSEMGRSMIRSILESARNIHPHDTSEKAVLARKINATGDLNGLECLVKIGITADEYGEKNKIAAVITPEHRAYTDFIKNSQVNW
ncbi:hypothetical protein [Candidatus Mesenet endosymbiont of Agriotes lineatus]|uniref:hypothetical protein n=1 Tax=Candidatus Mesenet endosymbiont of Agriotes lineatus TaxID=3077948 RepID=UPI0030CD6948